VSRQPLDRDGSRIEHQLRRFIVASVASQMAYCDSLHTYNINYINDLTDENDAQVGGGRIREAAKLLQRGIIRGMCPIV
jgi:hypothetical protein